MTDALDLVARYDGGLFDLDGCIMWGAVPIVDAPESVAAVRAAGWAIAFVTNNASRTSQQVVDHLAGVGVPAAREEIVSSPQAAAALLARDLPAGATVLVVGGPSLAEEIAAAGLTPVRSAAEEPVAVVQGWAPEVGWEMLAEGMYAITSGARWMATNTDRTLPTERGLAPGNGALVRALAHASGATPESAGKPLPGLFHAAVERTGARRALAIGDRLDTDIEGGNRAGLDTFHTLTGVSTGLDAVRAVPVQRPTHIGDTLAQLLAPYLLPAVSGDRAACGDASAELVAGMLTIRHGASPALGYRAALALVRATRPDAAFAGDIAETGLPTGDLGS